MQNAPKLITNGTQQVQSHQNIIMQMQYSQSANIAAPIAQNQNFPGQAPGALQQQQLQLSQQTIQQSTDAVTIEKTTIVKSETLEPLILAPAPDTANVQIEG